MASFAEVLVQRNKQKFGERLRTPKGTSSPGTRYVRASQSVFRKLPHGLERYPLLTMTLDIAPQR